MKTVAAIITLLLCATANAQVPESEQWRYVSLFTSLYRVGPNQFTYTDTNGKAINLHELATGNPSILPVVSATGLVVRLDDVGDSVIKGYLINGTTDTLKLVSCSGEYRNFSTEVKVKDSWLKFQTDYPMLCCMGFGVAQLPPHYKCSIALERSTRGNIIIPFRLVLETGNRRIVSNEVRISCTRAQLRMAHVAIPPFTM